MLAGFGTQLNASEAPLANFPGTGTAIEGRDQLAAAGITPGVMKPLNVLVERGDAGAVAAQLRGVEGIVAANVIAQDGPRALSRPSRPSTAPTPRSRASSTRAGAHRRDASPASPRSTATSSHVLSRPAAASCSRWCWA